MREYTPENFIFEAGVNIILIVASYSLEDLRLLDRLNTYLMKVELPMTNVYVCDVSKLQSMDNLNSVIPGIGNAYQTPMIGVWEDGNLKQAAWGHDAVKTLHGMFPMEAL